LLFLLVVVYTLPNTLVFGKPTDPSDHANFIDASIQDVKEEVETAISNTFNTAESAIVDENDLGIVVKAAKLGTVVFNTCKDMIKKIDKLVKEAEKNIANLSLELKSLKQEDRKYKKEYFSKFSKAKSELRKVRQRLRKLADKTIKETRDLEFLIRSLDEYENAIILKVSLEKMSKLLDTSKKTLTEAVEKYNETIETFENLNSAIQIQNRYIRRLLNEESTEYKEFEEALRAAEIGAGAGVGISLAICIPLDITLTWGACSISAGATAATAATAAVTAEVILARNKAAWHKFQTITGNMIQSGRAVDAAILFAINGFKEEIEVLDKWGNSVDLVASNIEEYPEEYLRMIKPIRDLFISGLSDLRQSAEEFLSRGKLFEENIDIEN